MCRIAAKFFGADPFLIRLSSSRYAMSNTQCTEFSIPQWFLTVSPNFWYYIQGLIYNPVSHGYNLLLFHGCFPPCQGFLTQPTSRCPEVSQYQRSLHIFGSQSGHDLHQLFHTYQMSIGYLINSFKTSDQIFACFVCF